MAATFLFGTLARLRIEEGPVSQRVRLMLILAAAMLPLIVLAFGFVWRDSQAAEDRIAQDHLALARASALTTGAFLEGNLATLRALSVELADMDMTDDLARHQLRLAEIADTNPLWSGLGIHDAGGTRLVGASADAPQGVNVGDRPYFQRVINTGQPTVSSAIIGRASGRPTVILGVPITYTNGAPGALLASIQLDSLSHALLTNFSRRGISVSLVDADGQTIIHPDLSRVETLTYVGDRPEVAAAQRGEAGTLVAVRNEEKRLIAYEPVPASGWTIIVSEPVSAAMAPARELLWQGVGLLAGAVALVLGIGWSVGGVLARSYLAAHEARQEAVIARHSAEESQQEYQNLVDDMDGVVWEARADDLRFTFVSPAIEEILGFPVEHWLTAPARWSDHMHPEDRDFVLHRCVEDMREGNDHACEYRAIRADGEVIWLADMIRTVRDEDGSIALLRGLMIDVTARRQAEEERARLLNLEQRARAEVEEALRSRDEFLSIASHELRNPVAGIKGTAQLIQRLNDRGRLTEHAHSDYVETIVRTSDRLSRLVEDLLDVSRLRGGQFTLRTQTVEISALVTSAIVGEALEGREVRLEGAEEHSHVRVDPDRVQQVLQNLLENAAKYSPPDTPIVVAIRRERDTVVKISVTDYGIGLPEGFADDLFMPFGRAANALSANIPGMGLGLYISRRLAEAHGGSLTAASAGEGRGSTFTLVLPVTTEGAATAGAVGGGTEGPSV